MAIATPEVYAQMLDKAKAGAFAYPAINVSSSQTLIGAIRGFAEAKSDGIVQISWGGAEYLSGSTVKNMVYGAVALAEFGQEGGPCRRDEFGFLGHLPERDPGENLEGRGRGNREAPVGA